MVKWTFHARNDLRALFEYISLDSKFYAKKVVREVVELASTIPEMPQRGRIVPEVNEKDVREIFIYSYRLASSISCRRTAFQF